MWGLIVIAVGLGILAVAAGVVFDLGVALIVLLGAAGVILVVGSVVSSFAALGPVSASASPSRPKFLALDPFSGVTSALDAAGRAVHRGVALSAASP